MGTYLSAAELTARYAVLDKWGKSASQVESDLIFYAEAELNSRLALVFTVPFTEVPAHPTIKDLTADLAYVKGLETRDFDKWKERYSIINSRIGAIVNGDAYIVTGSGTSLSSQAGEIWSSTQDYYPTHSMLDADESSIDPDLLDELRSDRV